MRYRELGRSGLPVSVLGLGCNNFGRSVDESTAKDIIAAAVDGGITFLDVADWYYGDTGGAEEMVGRAVAGRRDQVVISTKFGLDVGARNGGIRQPRGSRAYLRQAVEASLRRLGTDRIDVYQYHYPDGVTPIAETLAAMDELAQEGKVRVIGSANLRAWELVAAELSAEHLGTGRFESTQQQYNLLERQAETELVPACLHLGIGFVAFLALANGLLTGKYRSGGPVPAGSRLSADQLKAARRHVEIVDALHTFARDRGVQLLDVALGGLIAQPGVSCVLAGATSVAQVQANIQAADWIPEDSDLVEIDRMSPDSRPRLLEA